MNNAARSGDAALSGDPVLKEICALLDAFEVALEEEYLAIRERRLDDIKRTTRNKQSITEALADFPSSVLDQLAHNDALTNRVQRCAEFNRRNGGALELSRAFTSDLLTVLRGQTKGPDLYGAAGRVEAAPSSRDISKA